MKKLFRYFIPIAGLAIFVVIMLSGEYLKKPLDASEDVMSFVSTTIEDTKVEDWTKVKEDVYNLEHAWNRIAPRIQFSVERDEIYNIGINIARLKGALTSEDKSSALIELYELIENWNELSK
ncbi:DUF4363 family protein [Clostridium bovifaecis]|uniref:DUF4363 family protein n=1 Tax=Clostridium bovifaecis TaxID=2184719 RepID=A0A6I6EYC0_9CLOT|nr:DUF4363 family protein [Clostridium bovifaecis]